MHGSRDHLEISQQRRRLLDGALAGATATAIMTGLIFAAPALGGPRLPLVAARMVVALRLRPGVALLALGLHLSYGTLAGGFFAVATRTPSLASGLFYGLGLWAVAFSAYAPMVGLGFLAGQSPGLAVLALPPHLLYGAVLGAFLGARPSLAPRSRVT